MNKYILLIIFMFGANAYSQNTCCITIDAGRDTVFCSDSIQLHATFLNPLIGEVLCTTNGNPQSQADDDQIGYTINGSLAAGEYAACGQVPWLIIVVIDSVCLTAWNNCNKNFGQYNLYYSNTCQLNDFTIATCRDRPENYFEFPFDSTGADSAASMLMNRIPDGDFILAYTYEQYHYPWLPPSLGNAFVSLGFSSFLSLSNGPFIFFVQKGKPATAQSFWGSDTTSTVFITGGATINSSALPVNTVFSWSPGSSLNDSTIQYPKALPSDTITYYVTATDTVLHCTSIDSVTLYYDCELGIKQFAYADEMIVSPNPSDGFFHIQSASFKLTRIFLFNPLGQLIYITDADNSLSEDIDIRRLDAGAYLLQIETDKGTFFKRTVVINN